MSFQSNKIFIVLQNTNEGLFKSNLGAFCPSIDSYTTTTLKPHKISKDIIKVINVAPVI